MYYRIQGLEALSNRWITVDIASDPDAAARTLNYYTDNAPFNVALHYQRFRIRKPLRVRATEMLSRVFQYTLKPIIRQNLLMLKAAEGPELLNKYSTHVSKETRFLVGKMFPVVIRLFKSSRTYREIVLKSLNYMMEVSTKEFGDYPSVKGISGANVGIPFNLVVLKVCGSREAVPKGLEGRTIVCKGHHFLHMINPKIIDHSKEFFEPLTNCGSLQLEKKIRVRRYSWVVVKFCDRAGDSWKVNIGRPISGTAQHEIDHNNGILITERVVKKTEKHNSR